MCYTKFCIDIVWKFDAKIVGLMRHGPIMWQPILQWKSGQMWMDDRQRLKKVFLREHMVAQYVVTVSWWPLKKLKSGYSTGYPNKVIKP